MIGKERILSAFQHRERDRVPIYEQAFASDVASKILGRKVYTGGTSLHYEETKAWMKGEGGHQEFEEKPSKQIDEYTFLYGDKNKKEWHINRFDPVSQTFGIVDSWENHLQPEDIPQIIKEMEKDYEKRNTLTEKAFSDKRKLLDMFGEKLLVFGRGYTGIPYTSAWLQATLLYPE